MIEKASMGAVSSGAQVDKYTLKNASGAYCEVSTYGGCLMALYVPDQNGTLGDVLLGYTDIDTMQRVDGYMGMLVGRYANRIGGASFELNGRTYQLAKNNGENHLHGGKVGFDKKVWDARIDGDSLVLTIVSEDGDEGYPGQLTVTVTYTLTDDNRLVIHYEAETDQDTIVNMTNHAYFNLSGSQEPSLAQHEMQINADAITPVSSPACITTGELMPVDGTPFDLRTPRNIVEGLSQQDQDEQMTFGNGYDHNFVIKGWDGTLRQACVTVDHASGRRMETWTDQPGVQFYSGNSIRGDIPGKQGVPYVKRQGFCLETQHYPDTPHHANFPTCVLKKGEKYDTTTEYRFSVL